MRKRQSGQAFILVLILLAIGALLTVPALRLTATSLKSSQIVEGQTKALYAADAAQEYVLWKLMYDGYGATLYEKEGKEDRFTCDVCGIPVNVYVVIRTEEGQGGLILATDDTIRPTKTVEVEGHPEWSDPDGSVQVTNDYSGPYTYTIKLDQLSSEDDPPGLDAVYDVLPKGLDYIPGSSLLRVDGGAWTDDIGEPSIYTGTGGQNRLRWPYDGYFELPMRKFGVREVKEIKFQATGSLSPTDGKFYNWVLLKLRDEDDNDINTLSGPIAPIKMGSATKPQGGLLEVGKRSDPEIIQPRVETEIEYTISITNLETQVEQIYSITDYLPPDFEYLGPTSGITTVVPQMSPENINGVDRLVLRWTVDEFPNGNAVSIASGETLTLTFRALATKDVVSGTYYNEVIVVNKYPLSGDIYEPPDMSVGPEDFLKNYSWNTGRVIVPAYDSQTETGDVTINANMSVTIGGVIITSWQVE